jgi:hypothetical protein
MTAALLAAALSASPAAAQSQPGDASPASADESVSAKRVSRGLHAPKPMQVPPPADIAPTFRVDVRARPRLETALDAVRRELATNPRFEHLETLLPGVAVPAVSVDVLPAIVGLARQLQRARRERSERRMHDEVSAELAELCAVNDCSVANEGLLLPDKP